MNNTRIIVAGSLFVLAVCMALPARADAPPPDGQKYVGFALSVDGLAATPDHVVVAYPWSLSSGAPTYEHAVLTEGTPLRIGRRSPDVVLWAVPKAAWEAFEKTLPPAGDEDARRAALAAFFAGPTAVRCNLAPEHVWTLPTSDPRDVVEDRLAVEAIDATTCRLARVAMKAPAPTKSGCGAGGEAASGLVLLALVTVFLRTRARPLARRG